MRPSVFTRSLAAGGGISAVVAAESRGYAPALLEWEAGSSDALRGVAPAVCALPRGLAPDRVRSRRA